MKKKKVPEERKPDLHEADDQAAIESRIKEMMEIDPPKSVAKPITVTMHDDESSEPVPNTTEPELPPSAPELPSAPAKKPVPITIIDHNDIAETDEVDTPEVAEASVAPVDLAAEEIAEEPAESDPELLAAIEEVNNQLLAKESEPIGETADENVETAPSAPEVTDASAVDDDDSVIDEPEPEINTPEPEPEPDKPKPLSHLDSIVPKNRVEETLESTQTDQAVDDIIATESDALLKAEDEKLAEAFKPEPVKTKRGIVRRFFGNKVVRIALVLALIAGIAAAATVPTSRYYLLNTAGVRSSASVTVLDSSTQQPLKGVKVNLAGEATETNEEGKAQFSNIKLGQTDLVIEKRAFAPITQPLVIGWGSNPLPEYQLTPTGSQYTFIVTDYLSGKPVDNVEAASNEASAQSNEKGEIKLTIDQQDDTPRDVIISGDGYREEKFQLNLDQKEPLAISLVPARKHVFISKRSGKYDVYKVDVDGQNEKLVLPGTGSERDDMVLISHPTAEVAALVSTKDNKRNNDGFLLSTLTVMNLNEETTKSVVTSERVQVIDWVGSKVVYVAVKEGASGDSPDRHTLASYDYQTQEYHELAKSNYFNDVMVAGGKVYYAPTSTYATETKAALYRVNADGSDKQELFNQEVWNIFRTNYDKLVFAVQQDWYELAIGQTKPGKISGEPPSQVSRVYIDNGSGSKALWVDSRDGKGVLLGYDTQTNEDTVIRTQGGLKDPIRWLSDNVVIYRISTESETADYVLNLDGGEPKKIRDVTNTSGVNTWYFY